MFNPGTLHMSTAPEMHELCIAWGDLLSNRILSVCGCLGVLFLLNDFIRLMPLLLQSLGLARVNSEIEHSLNMGRMRRRCALCCALPFCLLCSRYRVYDPEFIGRLDAEWYSVAVIGVFVAYLLVRRFCFVLTSPSRNHEASASIHRAMYSYFIFLAFVLLAVCAVLAMFRVPDAAVANVILWISGAFFLFGTFRTGEIIASHCSGLRTILYLCTLEIIPAGILVASAKVL